MSRKRDYIPYKERLAAALARLLPPEIERELRAMRVTADAIIALFNMDHIVLHALDGTDDWWNLDPKEVASHKEKSRRDTSIVAKVKRIEPKWNEFMAKMARPDKGRDRSSKKPRRSFKPRKPKILR
jgi:hypothetical protein